MMDARSKAAGRTAALCCGLLFGGCSPGMLGSGPAAADASVDAPLSADSTLEATPESSCAGLAAQQGWLAQRCEREGNGLCGGQGAPTSDCDLCCAGPSCAELTASEGWSEGRCETDGNGACGGQGTPTRDCDHCCEGDGDPPPGSGFGYPVGDRTSWPAGSWNVWQVLGHVNKNWSPSGHHLGQDLAHPDGGAATIDQPVYSVANGTVLYAKTNTTTYKHVVLIRHPLTDGSSVCSFYGHIGQPTVRSGEQVARGQLIATVADWASCTSGGASGNSHLHYVLLSAALCAQAAAAGDGPYSNVCGYDRSTSELGYNAIDNEPYAFTAIDDDCGNSAVTDGFLSPTQFIDQHHH